MSKTFKGSPDIKHARRVKQPRNISVRAVRRDQPDLRKLSRALIQLAMAEAAAEAAARAAGPDDISARVSGVDRPGGHHD